MRLNQKTVLGKIGERFVPIEADEFESNHDGKNASVLGFSEQYEIESKRD